MSQRKTILTGAAFLAAAACAGKVLGFYYRIFLSRAIGAEGVGIYQLIFPIYALCCSLTMSGIHSTISRFVAAKTALGDEGGARKIFQIGLSLSLTLSLLVSLLLLRFHSVLAVIFVKEPRASQLLYLLAFVLPFGAVHSCINGYYFGKKQAKIPALAEVLEHVVRLGTLVFLVEFCQEKQIPLTPAVAVCAMIAEEGCAALFSVTVISCHFAGHPLTRRAEFTLPHYLKELLFFCTPLTMNRVLINMLQSIEALLIPLQLRLFGLDTSVALSLYGILTGMALPLILFPTALISPIATMLLPVVSEAQARQDTPVIRRTLRRLCFWCLALGLFCGLCFLLGGSFFGQLLFQNPLAGYFIRSMAWLCPLIYLNPPLAAILSALGKTSRLFRNNLLGTSVRILFILFAIPKFGISGYLAGFLVNQALVFLLSLQALRKAL